MKYALTGRMSKEVDRFTIDKMGVPSLVLMERAAVSTAMKVAEIVALFRRNVRILAVCVKGKNGPDAVAAARILSWQGVAGVFVRIKGGKKGICHTNDDCREQWSQLCERFCHTGI